MGSDLNEDGFEWEEEAPPTERDPAGPRWWGTPKRGLLARRHLEGLVIEKTLVPAPRRRRRGRRPDPELARDKHLLPKTKDEKQRIREFGDAIRGLLGLEPLYVAERVKKHGGMPVYDEVDREWKS